MKSNSLKTSKPILSIDKQINLFKIRGMIFENESNERNVLNRISSQRLNFYKKFFIGENKCFIEGTTFQNLLDIYLFDFELRTLLLKIITSVEISLRAQIVNIYGAKYGIHGHLNPDNFEDKKLHEFFIEKLEREYEKNKKNEIIKKHRERYSDSVPLYKAVEFFSFGNLSKFYSNLKSEDKKLIRKSYRSRIIYCLESWFESLVHLRNICAHNMPILVQEILTSPKQLENNKNFTELNPNKLWIRILVLKEILTGTLEWTKFKNEFENLILKEKNKNKILEFLNMPIDWQSKL